MKKKVAIILAAVLVLGVTGCGDTSAKETRDETEVLEAVIENAEEFPGTESIPEGVVEEPTSEEMEEGEEETVSEVEVSDPYAGAGTHAPKASEGV